MICFYRVLFVFSFLTASRLCAAVPSYPQEQVPQRLILTLTAAPSSSMAITWATQTQVNESCVHYAEATAGTDFAKAPEVVAASLLCSAEGQGAPEFHYSAVLTGLKPATTYCYRVGAGQVFSEWNQFCTAAADTRPFSFVWFGDPQSKILEHCSRLFREAYRTAPRANFWLFTGDLCDDPLDWQWGEFFSATGFSLRTLPSVMTPGNHDLAYKLKDGKVDYYVSGYARRDTEQVGSVWRNHLTLPENGLKGLEETSYFVDYQGVRLILINSNSHLAEQAQWLEGLLSNNPARWTLVAFHHPLYSGGEDRDNRSTRDAFLALFDKYQVDLVLTGHDHVYMRSKPLRAGQVLEQGQKGTVYMVSASGPKFYSAGTPYGALMACVDSGKQLFQVIEVKHDQLQVRTYTATGELFDSCVIGK